jgi:MFS family permease
MGSCIDYMVLGAADMFDLPLWVLFISRTLSGTSSAAFCMAYAYVADVSEPHSRSKNFGLLVRTPVWPILNDDHSSRQFERERQWAWQ